MGKNESDFERRIGRIRRNRSLVIFGLVVLFLGLNTYVGYSLYQIYTVNNFTTQFSNNEANLTLTITPTNVGAFLFDELNSSYTNSVLTPLSALLGSLGGSSGSSNSSNSSSSSNPLQTLMNFTAFNDISSLANDTQFQSDLNNSAVQAEYNLTQTDVANIEAGNINMTYLISGMTLGLSLPLAIDNPSIFNIDAGKIQVDQVDNGTTSPLINYQIPTLKASSNTTVNISIQLNLPLSLIAGLMGGGGNGNNGNDTDTTDNGTESTTNSGNETNSNSNSGNNGSGSGGISDLLGGISGIDITLQTSLLVLYPITITGSVDLSGLMSSFGGSSNGNSNGTSNNNSNGTNTTST